MRSAIAEGPDRARPDGYHTATHGRRGSAITARHRRGDQFRDQRADARGANLLVAGLRSGPRQWQPGHTHCPRADHRLRAGGVGSVGDRPHGGAGPPVDPARRQTVAQPPGSRRAGRRSGPGTARPDPASPDPGRPGAHRHLRCSMAADRADPGLADAPDARLFRAGQRLAADGARGDGRRGRPPAAQGRQHAFAQGAATGRCAGPAARGRHGHGHPAQPAGPLREAARSGPGAAAARLRAWRDGVGHRPFGTPHDPGRRDGPGRPPRAARRAELRRHDRELDPAQPGLGTDRADAVGLALPRAGQ